MPVRTRSPLRGAILLAALASAACNLAGDEARREIPGGYLLMQKGDFQALYDDEGRLVRLLQDRNHDGRAEVVILYYPNGTAERGEIDTDGDGVVDRWEYFRGDGSLEKVGRSRARDVRPDSWE